MRIFSYIDPGTGSLFVQAILGTVLAGTVILRGVIKRVFYKLKLVFSRRPVADEEK